MLLTDQMYPCTDQAMFEPQNSTFPQKFQVREVLTLANYK